MKCYHKETDCNKVDTSGMTKIECSECENYSKRYACIASIPSREKMLEKTIESIRHQVDDVYVALNDYDNVPEFLKDCHAIILDNSKGDAGKHYWSGFLKGYILTCDDDLIYPPGYVEKMIEGIRQYPNCAVTLHGRDYPRPVTGFQRDFKGYPCLGTVIEDTEVDIGGDGVMCYHTDFLKVKFEDFKSKNMSQLWFSKLCKEQGVPIMVLKHQEGYLGYMNPSNTIWEQSAKEGFVKQTALLKEFLT
jgi:glycosyltransferase involved in cell wall biosynthesis